ncbi:hypothetical protein Q4491_20080 [Photobacterium sp. 2_MG-2023]|uniref:hypothetical protein n=1 Tax=Photobacterium sp. 2_MG-2023 TaxID=3062663 RepID=UPI0026E36784|nr:hypothetical protein [Photobacterium sp. 2_MG-2023]MDO6583644.1 hypothetical protein [Photobacterium sp. 2_MG-2023]
MVKILKIMRLWKIYFWLSIYNLIMAIRLTYQDEMTFLSIIDCVFLLFAVIGLQGYVYRIQYFSAQFWRYFSPFFMVWPCLVTLMIIDLEAIEARAMALISFLILTYIPMNVALYRYKSLHPTLSKIQQPDNYQKTQP